MQTCGRELDELELVIGGAEDRTADRSIPEAVGGGQGASVHDDGAKFALAGGSRPARPPRLLG